MSYASPVTFQMFSDRFANFRTFFLSPKPPPPPSLPIILAMLVILAVVFSGGVFIEH